MNSDSAARRDIAAEIGGPGRDSPDGQAHRRCPATTGGSPSRRRRRNLAPACLPGVTAFVAASPAAQSARRPAAGCGQPGSAPHRYRGSPARWCGGRSGGCGQFPPAGRCGSPDRARRTARPSAASGKLVRIAVTKLLRIEMQQRQQFAHALVNALTRPFQQLRHGGDILLHGPVGK